MANVKGIEPAVPPSGTGCVECLATDGWWFHLRRCARCGHVGCCDSSPSQHASRHAAASGIRSSRASSRARTGSGTTRQRTASRDRPWRRRRRTRPTSLRRGRRGVCPRTGRSGCTEAPGAPPARGHRPAERPERGRAGARAGPGGASAPATVGVERRRPRSGAPSPHIRSDSYANAAPGITNEIPRGSTGRHASRGRPRWPGSCVGRAAKRPPASGSANGADRSGGAGAARPGGVVR